MIRNRKTFLATVLGANLAVAVLSGGPAVAAEDFVCPILDVPPRTFMGFDGGYVLPAETTAKGWDEKVGMVDAGLWGELFFWENQSGGDFSLSGHWNSLILQGFDGSGSGYPLNMGYLKFQWTQRFVNGYGLRLDAEPGVYSSLATLKGDDFGYPCGLTGFKAVNTNFAFLAGASVYPTFDTVVEPRLGFRWRPSEYFTLDLAYPESRMEAGDPQSVRFVMGARMWRWPEYGMGDDPRERLRLDEGRGYAGLEWSVSERVQISLLGGYAFGRKIEFEKDAEAIELEDAWYFQFGLAGLF